MATRPRAVADLPLESDALFDQLDDTEEHLNGVWFGKSGHGKTSAIASMANRGKIVLVNAEAGLKRKPLEKLSINTANISVFPRRNQVLTFETMEALYWQLKQDLEDDPDSWYGVGLDTGPEVYTKLRERTMDEAVRKAEAVGKDRNRWAGGQDIYTETSEQFRWLLRRFRDLPCHFVMTAQERREQDEDGEVKYFPSVIPSLQESVYQFFDVVLHQEVFELDGKRDFTAWCQPGTKYECKDRFGLLPRRLFEPSFERVLDYLTEDMTSDDDPIQLDAKQRAQSVAGSKLAAAAKAQDGE